ncbi:MAG: hypothetical protein E7L01_07935 [Paenibacillus macerans]|uniref:hypothetical protein n=1 Tax=Paenibacillus macerans TaxID=44252 RepID=UPI001B00A02C|nr:hypothetical protein [Paenibacillus macerans]MDU7473272.1 hypothetical protein [Paenibacillus macerans]GIP08938.1 hypothetical protein J1TS5_11080 [Paenibacillus macerans]
MEINAGTELQPFSSRFNSEQDCMKALIAMKTRTRGCAGKSDGCTGCERSGGRQSHLGLKHLQAYLNEYTGRRRLRLPGGLPGAEETMRQKLLQMCVAIPAIPYRRLIARQPNQPLAAAA